MRAARPGSSRASEYVSDELAAALVQTAGPPMAPSPWRRIWCGLPTVLAALLALAELF
jgi:hypothetical protein